MRDESFLPGHADELRRQPFDAMFGVWLAARGITALIGEISERHGWLADEFAIATMIDARGETTTAELARWMAAPVTTVSSLLRRLERRGDATRRRNPIDARSWFVSLTAEGDRRRGAILDDLKAVNLVIERHARELGLGAQELGEMRLVVDDLRASGATGAASGPGADAG